jgi:predicted permease
LNLATEGELRDAEGLWVSGSFFSALGVRAELGRLLTAADDRPGCGWPGAVISHAFWQREFGGDNRVLARFLPIDGHSVPIVGVAASEFFGVEVGRRFDVALPICSAPEADLKNRRLWFLAIMGRLRPGMTEASARAGIRALAPSILEATLPPSPPLVPPPGQAPATPQYKQIQFDVEPAAAGRSEFRNSFRRPLVYLLCMVALLLMLACANLANMMLARATAREHEFAVRRSLGASGAQLVRQVLVESFILAMIGAGAGAVAAPVIGRAALRMLSTQRDPIFVALGADGHVLGFTIAAACLSTLLFGLTPALRAAQANTRGATAGCEKLSFRRALLAAQVALCVVLLTTAFLFSQSFRNLLSSSPGFDSRGILVANVFLNARRHAPGRRAALIDDLHRRVSAIPGVSGVARSFVIPISGSTWDRGARVNPSEPLKDTNLTSVSEDYFRVMKTPLLAGRSFNTGDRPGTPPVAIVNQAFARAFFGGLNPVGKSFRLDGPEPPFEIVGLAGDTKYGSLAETFTPIAYLAAGQEQPPGLKVRFIIRSDGKPETLIAAVRSAVLDFDPNLTMRLVVLQTQIQESVLRERLLAAVTGFFGILGAMLAVTGVFGVTSYVVSRRNREFGVRLALGATGQRLIWLILRETALVLLAGIAAGALPALAAGKAAATALYGIQPYDLKTFLLVAVVLAAVGLAAAFVPALRAGRVAPVEALRVE